MTPLGRQGSKPSATTTLRPLGPADAALLAELHSESFPEDPWSSKAFYGLLTLPGAAGFLANNGKEPLGFLLGYRAADIFELVTLAVRPAHRRQGLARLLLAETAEAASAAGALMFHLEVAADNDSARRLYESQDFAYVGQRENYYRRKNGVRISALLYSRSLGDRSTGSA